MLDRQTEKLMKQEQKAFGITPGFQQYSPYPFGGMNQESSARQGMPDQDFWLLENFVKTGPGCLRTIWDQGAPIYTAPSNTTIIYRYFFNIGSTNYAAIFLSDGTAIQINTVTFSITSISDISKTFYNSAVSSQIPVCGQWGSTYLLIANNFASNGYWVWDGSTLHTAGSLSPLITVTNGGSGYTSSPSITPYGGSGSGATFSATVTNGSVVSVRLVSPGVGYLPGDTIQLYFSGGGSTDGVELMAVLALSNVQSVILTSGGSGFTPGVYNLSFSGGGGGSGAAGTYTVNSDGVVVSTIITANGSGYTDTPTVAFPDGGGSSATGIVYLSAGSVASVTVVHGGTGLTGTPTLTFFGGGGSGATAVATLTAGVITAVDVTATGIGYTSAPSISVQNGLNNTAAAVVTLMPFGISGTCIETYLQRVWIGHPYQSTSGNGLQQNGTIFNVSAVGSFTDFASSDGGLQYVSSDSLLKIQYINIKQSNGYLYFIGDSSVSIVSNVSTSGSPPSTTFNYQNVDPQIGTSWRDTLQFFSRTILFANVFGVFGIYGGSVKKVSDKIDNLFINIVLPENGGVVPTASVANIFNLKMYVLNLTIKDPLTALPRNVMVAWDEKEWYILSQSSVLLAITDQKINSDLFSWGDDSRSVYPLFTQPHNYLVKRLATKLYGQENFLIQKEAMGLYLQVQDLSSDSDGVTLDSVKIDAEHGSYFVPQLPTFPATPIPYYGIVSIGTGDVTADNLGVTLVTSSKDMSVTYIGLGHIEVGSLAMASDNILGEINTQ